MIIVALVRSSIAWRDSTPPRVGRVVQLTSLAGGTTKPVSLPTADPVFDPVTSLEGDRLAVYTQVGPRGRAIWTMPLTSDGAPLQLTTGDHEDSHPAWSADGQVVYFVRNHQDLYAVAATGGDPWPITRYRSFSTAVEFPAATPDGRGVLFSRVDKAGDIFLLHLALLARWRVMPPGATVELAPFFLSHVSTPF